MKLSSLDTIVRSVLLRKRISLHYYLDCLLAGRDILRTLTIDDLQIVNVKMLPVDSNGNIEIPEGFVDWCYLDVAVGQRMKPLVPNSNLNSLNNYDTSFNVVPYNGSTADPNGDMIYYGGFQGAYWNEVTFNSFGESTGRMFGIGAGNPSDGFKVVMARNQIQLDQCAGITQVVLGYISDGRDADAASQIPVYAEETIEAYIMWQLCENSRSYGMGEKERMRQLYINQRLILRARLSDLTVNVLKRIVQRNSRASIK